MYATGSVQGYSNEVNLVSRKEFGPIFAKTKHVLGHYDRALSISSIIMDRTGLPIKSMDFENQFRFCDLCRKAFYNPSQIWQGDVYPCTNMHLSAIAESRHNSRNQIYSCKVGFAFWASSLYCNGRYAGALSAGMVLNSNRDAAAEKFHSYSNDRIVTEKFHKLLREIPERDDEEITAMARLLGLCAEDKSEKKLGTSPSVRLNGDLDYPLEKEETLLAAFRRGDSEAGIKILDELINFTTIAKTDDLDVLRVRAMQLLVLLSRAASEKSLNSTTAENNVRYLNKIMESRSLEELAENLRLISRRMAVNVFSFQGMRHSSVLRKAERYIRENYTGKIGLKDTAMVSGLSAPYFSSIFKEEMGENFSNYLNRLRIERAVSLLTGTNKPLNEIASICGFEDQSWFSKIFKKITGLSPAKYRGAI
jgi:AraC-like DNA-binding protein/ligand-binding sensor protein